MKTKKICLIGDFSVGKTSLVKRFVHSIFSEKYITSIGVKIDTKLVTLKNDGQVKLVIWDVAGTDKFTAVDAKYLKGAQGYLLVADGTRLETVKSAVQLDKQARQLIGNVPRVFMLNKADLMSQWEVQPGHIKKLEQYFPRVFKSSAKDGSLVEEAFEFIAST